MPPTNIILNASPLILLCNGNLAFVLPEMFTEIIVPEAVWQEVLNILRFAICDLRYADFPRSHS